MKQQLQRPHPKRAGGAVGKGAHRGVALQHNPAPFTLAELADVSGRLMFSGLDLLLGQSHVFLDPDGTRLADVLKKSRSFQAVVSNALADQVLAALWDLLRSFQQADELAQRQDAELLGELPQRDPQQIYGGLITVLMRLVFLLYAEDEALMPADAVCELNYKVSGIYEQLQRDAAEYPDTMKQRYGAWEGLMSLCRLVFDGGGPSETTCRRASASYSTPPNTTGWRRPGSVMGWCWRYCATC